MKLPNLAAIFAILLLATAGCAHQQLPVGKARMVAVPANQQEAAALFAELGGDDGFFQIVHYLYRWQFDENDFKPRDLPMQRQIWLRRLRLASDANDKSQFLELVMPAIGASVILKKPDYQISELNLDVKSNGYRIIRVGRESHRAADVQNYVRLDLDPDVLYDRLFQARLRTQFPGDPLLARMKGVASRLAADPAGPARTLTLDVAPVDAIASEAWIYCEERKLLFRFTSDLDLATLAVTPEYPLGVAVYDAVQQTLVSYEEKPGDNRYLTRDQVGRALYNCLVLGRKTTTGN